MRTNEDIIEYLRASGYATSEIINAMRKYPRGLFLPSYQKENAYFDLPLPIGDGQTCSAPSMVATVLSFANIAKGQHILEIGTGSAWQTALISELVGGNGSVVSIDLNDKFTSEAEAKFAALGITNVRFAVGDGKRGWHESAPYDRIIVSAACDRIFDEWVQQLKEGGIIIVPIGDVIQHLYRGIKKNGKIELTQMMAVQFVKLM